MARRADQMDDPRILLTNDDGIDAPGIASLHEALRSVGDVTVVAPVDNQSGVGRTRNGRVTVTDHSLGHAVAGTPADCVAFGLGGGLDQSFDLVVAGVNNGPNIGNYVVGRSGTVGAAIEAAFIGVPAVAVSAYHTREYHCYPPEEYDYTRPARAARRLVESLGDAALFDDVGLLNVNAPVDVAEPGLRLTRPVADYGQRVEPDDEAGSTTEDVGRVADDRTVRLVDQTWPHVDGFENPMPGSDDLRDRYPVESDRRALLDGDVSVSPLSTTHEYVESPGLDDLLAAVDVD